MDNSNCHDVVFYALKNANKADGSPLNVSDNVIKRLERACVYLDGFTADADNNIVQVVVLNNCLYISIDCACFFNVQPVFNMNPGFPKLVAQFDKVSFSQVKSDNVRVTLKINLV